MIKYLAGGLAAFVLLAAPALAAPAFPPLTGRVVDEADILSAPVEAQLTTRLEQIKATTHHQVVVATIKDLKNYEIEDYGYQLGRAWKIGDEKLDDGVLLIIAPNSRKVRIEVGYGVEPILTDALSSVIIQSRILPKFRSGDMEAGIKDGVEAIGAQLGLPQDQALAVAQQAATRATAHKGGSAWPIGPIITVIIIFMIFSGMGRRGRRGGSALGSALPWILLGALNSRGGRDDWGGGGGWSGGGGGGFSGGGGSFGGGGASGGW